MEPVFVRVLADVYCTWSDVPPVYRLWVNDELFAERTWIWQDQYLVEAVQISAPPGEYTLTWQLLPGTAAELTVKNLRAEQHNATVCGHTLRIH
jgi:hypothetical protein